MERIWEGSEGDSEISVSQAVPLKETRSQVWILPGHLTPAQRSVLTSLSPKGVGVLKGPGPCRQKGKNGDAFEWVWPKSEGEADYKKAGPGLTSLHGPHSLCADFHAWCTLHRLHLLRRAPVVCVLHTAVTLQGLRSWGCRDKYN